MVCVQTVSPFTTTISSDIVDDIISHPAPEGIAPLSIRSLVSAYTVFLDLWVVSHAN